MPPEKCATCRGSGLKENRPCQACDGNGLTGLSIGKRKDGDVDSTPKAATETDTKSSNGQSQLYQYWPTRMVTTVHLETLKLWRRDLESKAEAVRGELAKFEGGIVQIDQEFQRREVEKKEKWRRATQS